MFNEQAYNKAVAFSKLCVQSQAPYDGKIRIETMSNPPQLHYKD